MIIGVIFCGIAVALGAFGAHGLRQIVTQDMLVVWETAVRYQFWHGTALITYSIWNNSLGGIFTFGRWFILGTLIFSGSLYLLVLTSMKWLGAVTPLGGVTLLIGWTLWAVRLWQSRKESETSK